MSEPLTDLEKQIDRQRMKCRCLESDLLTPHNLDRNIKEQREKVANLPQVLQSAITQEQIAAQYLPQQIDDEIAAARKRLQTLIDTRETRINEQASKVAKLLEGKQPALDAAKAKLDELIYRRAHTRELLQQAQTELQAMVKRQRREASAGIVSKVKQLAAQVAALEAALPPALRGKSIEEIQAALAGEHNE